MDLWSDAGRWTGDSLNAPQSLAPDHAHEHHDHPPLTRTAAVVMWITVLLPYLALIPLGYFLLQFDKGWLYLSILSINYLLIGFGVTIGYHRLLAHRSFNTFKWLESLFLIFGCMAVQGPPIRWAATHRRHHQTSDLEGDPHSPHLHGNGVRGVLMGLWFAHTGWLLAKDPHDVARSVKDLIKNPLVRFVDRYYALWIALSIVIPFTLGYFVQGSIVAALLTVFWAVIVRIALMHHATWSVNSICHFFGYQSYKSNDESRNNPAIALISLGEGWHNNHHAFPTSARHGLRWFEIDLSYIVIRTLELTRLVWDVRRPTKEALQIKAMV